MGHSRSLHANRQFLGEGHARACPTTVCCELCKNGCTDRDAVCVVDSDGPMEACVKRTCILAPPIANTIEPSVSSIFAAFLSNNFDHLLVHGQVTIIFVVSVCLFVCLFVCLCRVFLSRLRSDLDQTRTHVTCPGLVVSPRI